MLSVMHNLSAMGAERQLNTTAKSRAKTAEKLSSGYRINRSADDAAGLSISEKMRCLIRGLNQGIKNTEDGISMVQTADGALDEVSSMLQRMRELSIKAMNGTNSASDRQAIHEEYDQLRTEIARIGETTKFNDTPIFNEHENQFTTFTSARTWEKNQYHLISEKNNDLRFTYTLSDGTTKTADIKIPAGEYTTDDLLDEIDGALGDGGLWADGIYAEYNNNGTVSLCLEGGSNISGISGSLRYLFLDTYEEGNLGALIGTTTFSSETSRLEIVADANDTLNFTSIHMSDGSEDHISLTIPSGFYTRKELISELNRQLDGKGVTAYAYGTGVKLAGDDCIITAFKGNMFKIDTDGYVKHSVFYDNVKYADVLLTPAYLKGGAVLTSDARDVEHTKFEISSANNTLTFTDTNEETGSASLVIPDGSYTAQEMADKLNELIAADSYLAGKLSASVNSANVSGTTFYGITLTSAVEGNHSTLGLDPSGSAYNTLFTDRSYYTFSVPSPTNPSSSYTSTAAVLTGKKTISFPKDITTGTNDKFRIRIVNEQQYTEAYHTVTIAAGTYDKDGLTAAINDALNGASAPADIKGKLTASISDAGKLVLTSQKGSGVYYATASVYSSNSAYTELFADAAVETVYSSGNVLTLSNSVTADDLKTLNSSNNSFTLHAGGRTKTITLPTGAAATQESVIAAIETGFAAYSSAPSVRYYYGSTENGKTTQSGSITTTAGVTTEIEGQVGYTRNTGASAAFTLPLEEKTVIDSSNNTLGITINGVSKNITIGAGTYTKTQLVSALQTQLDSAFGTDYDHNGAIVSLDGSGRLTFTARLNRSSGFEARGASTSVALSSASGLYQELITKRTPGSYTISSLAMQNTIDITDSRKTMTVYRNGIGQNITLQAGTYTKDSFVSMLNSVLTAQNTGLTASQSGGYLKLTTTAKGLGNTVSKPTGSAMEAVYGVTVTNYPAVSASFTADGKLRLEASGGTSNSMSLVSNQGSIFQAVQYSGTSSISGSAARTSYVSGKVLPSRVTIDRPNRDLTVNYYQNGVYKSVSITMMIGTRSAQDLADSLKNLLEGYSGGDITAKLYNGQIEVFSSLGGYQNRIDSLSGGFYDRVMGTPMPHNSTLTPTAADGTQGMDSCYTVGRMDLTLDKTEIMRGVNDTLSFDYTVNGRTTKLEMDLDEGTYDATELASMIQQKLNVSLLAAGMPANYILATIGGIAGGSSMDNNALVFRINQAMDIDEEGAHVIDGVGGTAAFGVFYKTDRKIEVGYLTGAAELGKAISIEPNAVSFSADVDGQHYSVKIPAGTYSRNELITTMNNVFAQQNVPLIADLDNDKLKLKMAEYGKHTIENVSGAAADLLFYGNDLQEEERQRTRIVMSGEWENDSLNIMRHGLSASVLRLNHSDTLTEKRAGRASEKLSFAMDRVSRIRSDYGAMQNRMEHAVANHSNVVENTQAAESLIRDTDMAETAVQNASLNILLSAGTSVLAQANQNGQRILQLLGG